MPCWSSPPPSAACSPTRCCAPASATCSASGSAWWGLGLIGVAAGAPWSLLGPALMTFLLVRVSGVALLEKDIAVRRPGYRAYVARTNAFLPWFPRKEAA